ncbi:MAG: hypothetical protein ACT4PW_03315 [Acidimicrobiia bacterium]
MRTTRAAKAVAAALVAAALTLAGVALSRTDDPQPVHEIDLRDHPPPGLVGPR